MIDIFIELLESDESDKVQAAAAIALSKYAVKAEHNKLRPDDRDKVTEALLGAVDDRDKSLEVKRRALESAASLSIPDVKEAIMEAYESSVLELKISALYSMGKSCDRTWLPLLIKELKNAEPEIRYEAASSCGFLEDEEAVPDLIELTNDDDMEVRLAAILALGEIGTPAAKKCVEQYLESDNEAIREAAEEAAGLIDVSEDPLSFHNWDTI